MQAFGTAKVPRVGNEEGSKVPLNPTEENMTSGDYSSVLRARQYMRRVFEDKYYANNSKFMAHGVRSRRGGLPARAARLP